MPITLTTEQMTLHCILLPGQMVTTATNVTTVAPGIRQIQPHCPIMSPQKQNSVYHQGKVFGLSPRNVWLNKIKIIAYVKS